MRFAIALFLCLTFGASVKGFAQESGAAQPQHSVEAEEATSRCGQTVVNKKAESPPDDLKRMRTLIQQMQSNLAAVAAGETPLKHQFRLQIDMWQLQLERMERENARTRP
jgi:hypothetical protein